MNTNRLSALSDALAQCTRLRTLKVQVRAGALACRPMTHIKENCLPVTAFTNTLLASSTITTLCVEGNLFQEKELHLQNGYETYLARYTEMKRKMF
jgi:hypothetical protein